MDYATRLLIVDDDASTRNLMSSYLDKHGFLTDTASDPSDMRGKLQHKNYDLIVMDVMMPGEDGLSALQTHIKKNGPPVIMLSAVATDIDRIVGLEMGADDYVAKPCNPRELLARIRAVLRRHGDTAASKAAAVQGDEAALAQEDAADAREICFAGWRVDLDARMVRDPSDKLVALSDGEFRLLRAFIEHPRRVLTRNQLLDFARGMDCDHYDRAIDVQISRLRRKLADANAGAELIRTVRSEGYLFVQAVTRC